MREGVVSVYLLALVFLNAMACGHAIARFQETREWFYRLACPVFAIGAAVTACAIVFGWA